MPVTETATNAEIIPFEVAVARHAVCELLAELEGDLQTAWEVTLSMLPHGQVGVSTCCPVARWLVDRLEGRCEVAVDTETCAIRLPGAEFFEWTVPTPPIVAAFVQSFDVGRIPSLIG